MFPFYSPKSEKLFRRTDRCFPVHPSDPSRFNNSFFTSDEFRMFGFKIKSCPLTYRHDWTECSYVHPDEKARRRDPSQINYLAIACPEHRSKPGKCPRGELCGLANGIFEYWLHPAKYRTRPCNVGSHCNRKVCFFAHKPCELRPGVDYGVYWGMTAAAVGLIPSVKEAAELGSNGVGSDMMNYNPADVEWVWKLIE